MSYNSSPYTGAVDDKLDGKTALGRVTFVDPVLRRCTVKTLGNKNGTDDLDLRSVQWISANAHPDGDDDTCFPRIGAYGLVLFVNSEPYILGYFNPIPETGSPELPNKDPYLAGDRVLKTIAGNRIVLRTGGSVEIESTKLCRILFLPSNNLLNLICQNYDLETDGGYMDWSRDPSSGDTTLSYLAYDNLTPTSAVSMEYGKSESGKSIAINVGTWDAKGGDFKKKGLTFEVDEKGTLSLIAGEQKLTMDVDAETGDFTLVGGSKELTIKIDGAGGKIAIGVSGKELLKQISKAFEELGKVKILTVLGPAAPIMASAEWVPLKLELKKIEDITGSL